MPQLPKLRSSFKRSPKPAQPNLEPHLTAPSPQQRAFFAPPSIEENFTRNLTMVDMSYLTMVKSIHRSNHHPTPKPRQDRANALNASAQLASRECSRGCRRDGRHGIGRVRPGLSKVARPCRSLHPCGASPGSIASAGTAAALRGIPAVSSRQRAYTVKRVRRMRPRARTATPVGIPAPPSPSASGSNHSALHQGAAV